MLVPCVSPEAYVLCDARVVRVRAVPLAVLVAPSTDKAWIRAPWDAELKEIPDDLVKTVARPCAKEDTTRSGSVAPRQAVPTDDGPHGGEGAESIDGTAGEDLNDAKEIVIEFDGDGNGDGDAPAMRLSGARLALLHTFEYCVPLLSGRWAVQGGGSKEVPTLRMPCAREVLEEIFSLLETGELTQRREPTDLLLALVEAAADMLGCPPRKLSPLLERCTFHRDLFKISPFWWGLQRNEQALMLGTSPTASDDSLVLIDDELAQVTGYMPLPKDGLWLYPSLPHLLDPDQYKDMKVFMDSPEKVLFRQLPPPVMEILAQHSTCVAVAGGAVLGGVTKFINHGSDVDLFLYGLDREASTGVLGQIEELMQSARYKDVYDVSRSNAAITYTKKAAAKASKEAKEADRNAWLLDRPFQVVLGLHRARSQILEYFDLQPCKVRVSPSAASC